ncbi:tryptophan 2,3-dioxygenase (vermilion) [Owenweeksia hongkongensis DSM 17368]|uniref:Tryptophan 2,3-dioxygenase (Vermilion) n=1 Tax=Owenweeksia hongkongensis (strain DSM 17368 / CIP 108786 / JCM 12287 / NRRL B-23963 / UST20020801) TaxID=926562 RepID=G8R6F7_OWEHD|nr:tryptophan 2,3-dioxygenase family protein [Owenweeksia hongkongensis]AEV34420.1 tryptophan 2,3-dioxygenase (vermilion) [Owenweeksia hongkongensis DSM 17368]
MSDVNDRIDEKYRNLGENPETYKEGLFLSKPLTYWDYIQVDTLLSLQKPRTDYEDEKIFVIYHQVTELMQELVLHELRQITGPMPVTGEKLAEKVKRMIRYTRMLITSFDVMREGMDYDDYNTFHKALAPASGFQSANFRYIELRCTSLPNLVNSRGKKRLPLRPTIDDFFDNLYWKDAGLNRETYEASLTYTLFMEKYGENLKKLAREMQGNTLEDKVNARLETCSQETRELLREFDKLYNIEWPLVHLRTAAHYLDAKGETKAATGGSEWKKYLHPMYQQRKFFPSLYSEEELENWGKDYKI